MWFTRKNDVPHQRTCRLLMSGYIAFVLIAGIVNIAKGRPFYYLTLFSSSLIFPLMYGLYHFTGIRRAYRMDAVIYLYTFFALPLGVGCALYDTVPYYDKIMHGLSGILTMTLALPFYYLLKPGKRPERADAPQAIVFCVLCTLAVASIWEFGEYFVGLLTPRDPQNTLNGVHDTMQDMMVCCAASLTTIPSMIRYYKTGAADMFMTTFKSFADTNHLPAPSPRETA